MEYKIKGDGGESMKIKKDERLQLRISKNDKEKLKELSENRGFKNLSEYILYLAMKDISESEFINKRMKSE